MTAPRSRTRSKTTSTSTTTPSPSLTADVPGFATVTPEPTPEPAPAMTTPEEALNLDGQPSSASGSDEPGGLHDGQLPPREAAGSTPASTKPLDPKALREPLRKAVLGASMAINRVLVRPIDMQLGVDTGVWVATDDEAEGIGDPLADIAARHAPVGLGGANDLGDAIAAGLVLISYASKNLFEYLALRKALKAGGVSVLEQPADDGEQVPA